MTRRVERFAKVAVLTASILGAIWLGLRGGDR